jgi:prepilin-type N-terminal cleavage/methylation domain-containing protein
MRHPAAEKSNPHKGGVQGFAPRGFGWCPREARWQQAFTLVELLVGMAILGIAGTAICGAITMMFYNTQYSRENLRASQILAQTTEVIRLCNWDQTDPTTNFIPTSMSVPYYTDYVSVTNLPVYQLTVTTANPPPLAAWYSNDLRMLTIQATWTSGRLSHTQSVATYVSQWGLQNYVW